MFAHHRRSRQKGFTLLEVLLVVAAIAILAGIVIFAINPARQLAKLRNAQRTADVSLIMNALYQYQIDTGDFPADIVDGGSTACVDQTDFEICQTDLTSECSIDLSGLTDQQRYLVEIPVDPGGYALDAEGAGYFAFKNENGRIVICAPKAELGELIQSIR